jgi:hypothetical protein
MNEKIKEIALQTGGSHFPDVNSKLLEMFANMIIDECINAVKETELKEVVFTTYDRGMADGVRIRCVKNINQRFDRASI